MKRKNTKKTIFGLAIFWGAILASMGALSGNQMLITPDLYEYEKAVLEDQIKLERANCDTYKKQTRYRTIEFTSNDSCMGGDAGLYNYECLNIAQLDDAAKVRKTFPRLHREIITFSEDREQAIRSAALLKYYGYNVKLLKNPEALKYASNDAAKDTSELSVVKPIKEEGDIFEEGDSKDLVADSGEIITPIEEEGTSEDEGFEEFESFEEEGC